MLDSASRLLLRGIAKVEEEYREGAEAFFTLSAPSFASIKIMSNTLPKNRATKPLILVVEDEPKLSRVVCNYLERDGYVSQVAVTCGSANQYVYSLKPDLVILDIMLPDGSGLDVLKKLRTTSDIPVILLTAKSEEIDKIMGLEFGADDYVSKPFSVRELMARVKANLRRSQKTIVSKSLSLGKLELEPESMRVHVNNELVRLTTTEFLLLECLISAPNRVFSRNELFERAMPDSDALERVLNSHFRNLRKKLVGSEVVIESVRGIGYRLTTY